MSEPTLYDLPIRPRRNRRSAGIRALVRETRLSPEQLIAPLFVTHLDKPVSVASMPGIARLPIPELVARARSLTALGVPAVALFPAIEPELKDEHASEATNDGGLLMRAVRALKAALPELVVITDVAMDPYSSDGHDGRVIDGRIDNDATLPILERMAVAQARAGADWVAPSDMMDGRVGAIRGALDDAGFADVGILAYAAKYASAFYGPFRDALDSAPRAGDKKTYQMDPANGREAVREAALDELEGADVAMVKPALPYLDVIAKVREALSIPVAAYQVSGEYAMIEAVAANGWMGRDALILETLVSIRRAGADMVLTYHAQRAAELVG